MFASMITFALRNGWMPHFGQKGVRMAVEPWEFKPGLVLCHAAAPGGVGIELIPANG